MNNQKHVYNRLPDKPDSRDLMYSKSVDAALLTLPTTVDLRPGCPPVFDQGSVGSCTGNASVGAFDYIELQNLSKNISGATTFGSTFASGSRLFVYYNERFMNHTTQQDSGATIRDSVKSLLYYGVCKETTWAYDTTQVFTKPSDVAYQEASQHKISKYYRFADLDHVKHSLAAGFPVIIGISVFSSFESDDVANTGYVPVPDMNNEQFLGGHAVLVVGYDDSRNVLIVRNSWGPSWGDKGYFYLPYDYFTNPYLSSDWWSVRQ